MQDSEGRGFSAGIPVKKCSNFLGQLSSQKSGIVAMQTYGNIPKKTAFIFPAN